MSETLITPGICQLTGIIPNSSEWDELREEMKRFYEETRLKYYASLKDYLEMLATAQVRFRWDVYSSEVIESVFPRGFHKGLENMALVDLYTLLIDEVKWIQKMRY